MIVYIDVVTVDIRIGEQCDDVPTFIILIDYFVRKLRRSSKISKHASVLSGHECMLELLNGHDERFIDVLRMNKDCFMRLITLLSVPNNLEETNSITMQ